MLSVKHATQSTKISAVSPAVLFLKKYLIPISIIKSVSLRSSLCWERADKPLHLFGSCSRWCSGAAEAVPDLSRLKGFDSMDAVVYYMKEWFKSGSSSFLDMIFDHLSGIDRVDSPGDSVSQLPIHLSERVVLAVLSYGCSRKDVLSCLKFFDWSGRQRGFSHTRATYHAIFKILCKAKLMSVVMNFLRSHTRRRFNPYKASFNIILVMGYAMVGKPQVALQLFGRMRFQGIDLDVITYHLLLNSLVDGSCFSAVEAVAQQICLQGLENDVTHFMLVKSLCRQNLLVEAEKYFRRILLLSDGHGRKSAGLDGHAHALRVLVGTLCHHHMFDKAAQLMEEFREMGVVHMNHAYGGWLEVLVRDGKTIQALKFMQSKWYSENYVPGVFSCNVLLFALLRENRLMDACDVLMEMMEGRVSPDQVTMNAALCFFCKAGMIDVALEIYNSRSETGLLPNSMAYNCLINAICGDGSVEEACRILKDSYLQGFFPGRKTFSFLADALSRSGKFDKLLELVVAGLEHNLMASNSACQRLISALCRDGRLEVVCMIHGELTRRNKCASKATYSDMIHCFNKNNRGDIASRLLLEMQDKGHKATRNLFRAVVQSLLRMDDWEIHFFRLLEMQLSRTTLHHCHLYNLFIDGAGHAEKPDLAWKLYEIMRSSGVEPNLCSNILMLQSFLKNRRISEALNFFDYLSKRNKTGKKLYNTMVVGLCQVGKVDSSLRFLREMEIHNVRGSIQCYEVLIQHLCSIGRYDIVVSLLGYLEKLKYPITSFIGNVLLFNSLYTEEICRVFARFRHQSSETSSYVLDMGQLLDAFSSRILSGQHLKSLEEGIKQCFPFDTYTCNMLLRRASRSHVDAAQEFFTRMCQKGYEPNKWTYDIIVHGLSKHGRRADAQIWINEMRAKGFDLSDCTKRIVY